MKILLLNEGYSDNLGDQAIKDSLIYFLNQDGANTVHFHDFTKNLNKPIHISITSAIDHRNKVSFIKSCKFNPPGIRWITKYI